VTGPGVGLDVVGDTQLGEVALQPLGVRKQLPVAATVAGDDGTDSLQLLAPLGDAAVVDGDGAGRLARSQQEREAAAQAETDRADPVGVDLGQTLQRPQRLRRPSQPGFSAAAEVADGTGDADAAAARAVQLGRERDVPLAGQAAGIRARACARMSSFKPQSSCRTSTPGRGCPPAGSASAAGRTLSPAWSSISRSSSALILYLAQSRTATRSLSTRTS
jgi:hypothetical protein